MQPVLTFTDSGIYCPAGDFYIDPWKPVDRAVITHAHSDHARWGNKKYLCTKDSVPLLQLRLGQDIAVEGAGWGETVQINGAAVSFHPAGHMIGSAQVKVTVGGQTWVASGDYKTENDGISGQFEPIRCHVFITESTFGLPIYHWRPQSALFKDMEDWMKENDNAGKNSILLGYSLGKAQRLLYNLQHTGRHFLVHGAIYNAHEVLLKAGWNLPPVELITPDTPKERFKNSLVIAPPSTADSTWMRKLAPYSLGVCSGWMQVRGNSRRMNADAGFAISDHADWQGLLSTIKETGAEKVFVTHGFSSVLARYLQEHNIQAEEIKTAFGTEEETTA
ncbi:ligase-associated DNA damage response exonuclease [Chitinophaga barathri]|uniref:Ligase-associated DNA damage response exonuclease n=1 Tax=Chitinophaga barathri TaxID=1647451 RepID=A0A3N4MKU4_9BACT|nr:ligase-associated DNA damage response exonuclease [Chitinophaga barathri]RPD42676.1 ligase-associated DNA damage response exonuclease [Chitinophaga barathri]